MITTVWNRVRRFGRAEDGAAVVEFAITFPAMLMLLLSSVELGMVSLQHAMLERAMNPLLSAGLPPVTGQNSAHKCTQSCDVAVTTSWHM